MATSILFRASSRRSPIAKPTFTRFVMSRSQSTFRSYLVEPFELSEALKANAPTKLSTAPRTVPVCGSWFLPNDPQKRTGYQVYKQSHIPDAVFFDLDKVADTSSPYPHMLPSPEVFQDAMSNLGVNRDDVLVVYDTAELGIFSAPRVAWTLRAFGHPAVHILNNYKLWVEQGYRTEEGEQEPVDKTNYPLPALDRTKVAAFDQVKEIAKDYNKEGHEEIQILDARSKGRWEGKDPEPRPRLSSGHIPGSVSVPVPELLDPKTKAYLRPAELKKIFESKGVDPNKPIISSCGTGVTAVVIDAALTTAGFGEGNRRVYDGSWTEWAQRVQPTDNLILKSE
ncbi:Rhodanese-like protein [Hortaea werneckii]|nr:Rhodanese-like protein [Hortaea werneckii]